MPTSQMALTEGALLQTKPSELVEEHAESFTRSGALHDAVTPSIVSRALLLRAEVQGWAKDQLNQFRQEEGDDDPCLRDALKEMKHTPFSIEV